MDEVESKKKHWETVYKTKKLEEVSWYQPVPVTSLDFIKAAAVSTKASIIDIGGGDSFLVDNLLSQGYTNITVLDISATAIERAKTRLGQKSDEVTWILSDITSFEPEEKYDIWHDRAALHFLTSVREIDKYKQILENSIAADGKVIIGTFSENGPTKCSGIEIKQYSQRELSQFLSANFLTVECQNVDHSTPFKTSQSFIFCYFQKIK
ncbi:nodulation protein S (NodS) [Gillisia sp. Hel_I_86]|uniref:class I SAM-dependent methyltransferase n=1 Tax=Gillisia sp. Hel_I_86 TaxID=1249981 RepID=UPI0011993F60|nr:class I SAM-dependent methyltransferase [Gillisia sp. Hel_I_86]TVZ27580.1 nodulation protein S (NodS) [Gillisia sp. Hel_I_86]